MNDKITSPSKSFAEAVEFHGHACPGLAFGFRVAGYAMTALKATSSPDEELVAVVENKSCAIDAIQLLTGCTAGKGNLVFRDYGKQVYTFFKRQAGEGIRIAIDWEPQPEDPVDRQAWARYTEGDRAPELIEQVALLKQARMEAILAASAQKLFKISSPRIKIPDRARIFKSTRCTSCGEKVMEPKLRQAKGDKLCIPCHELLP